MANNLESNVTRRVLRSFLKSFESARVTTRTVDTRLFRGKFGPSSGTTVDIKRPHDYTTIRTTGGDISSDTKDDIVSGKATCTKQDFFTGALEFEVIEQALELDQLDEIMAPEAQRIVTDLEVDFSNFMMENCALVQGTPGEAINDWQEVANAGALMASTGIPADMPWYYAMNPFAQVEMSNLQKDLTAADQLVQTAWERAQIARNFGGLRALTSTALGSYTTSADTDFSGALNGTPTSTYVSVKDTMTQDLVVDGFTGAQSIVAGTVVEIPTRFILNQATREPALDASGANIPWRGVVQTDATLSGGAGTITVSSPAIYETLGTPTRDGAYNNVVAPLADNDVINIISATASTTFQPNMFYHPQAFSITTVDIPKLFSTDTKFTTKDGFTIRVSMYSDGDANKQKVRWDLVPCYAVLNPFFAGHGYGTA